MTASAARLFQVRSLFAEGLLAYLQAVRDWPENNAPAYLGGRSLTGLYVPPQVYWWERNKANSRQRWDDDSGQFRDEDEDGDPRRGKPEEQDQRKLVAWEHELPKLQRAVLAGRPREGKTLLARMSARKIAEAE